MALNMEFFTLPPFPPFWLLLPLLPVHLDELSLGCLKCFDPVAAVSPPLSPGGSGTFSSASVLACGARGCADARLGRCCFSNEVFLDASICWPRMVKIFCLVAAQRASLGPCAALCKS